MKQAPVVLLIEDDPGDATLIRLQLLQRSSQAFEVHTVNSLTAAKTLIDVDKIEPDVVLLDLNLPDSSGNESVNRCRALTEAPIVVLTGLDDLSVTQASIEAGAEDYLAKGGDASVLRRAIRYAILRHTRDADARLAATVFSHAREGVIIADPLGNMIDVNQTFTRITGFSREEAIGCNPRILKSGKHPLEFYQALWQELLDSGNWYGEVWNRRKNGEVFAELLTLSVVRDVRGRVSHIVGLFSDITMQKEHQKQLERIAHYDALTDLPNRVLVADRMQQAMARSKRNGRWLALAYIDLDGFKAINDTHGHPIGDQLLMTIADRMRESTREGDTIARLGGDEFVAVLSDLEDYTASLTLIQRLLEVISKPVHVQGITLQVSASIGISFYSQSNLAEAEQLLRQADQAMYQAKLAGKNRYHVFDVELDRSVRGHHESIERIRQGLQQHEFVLHYQPKVNMRTGVVVGVEALIRWQHPQRGLLLPADFLHLIEKHALDIEIGTWVLNTALAQIDCWQKQGVTLPVSINISAHHLQQPDFVERLHALLAAHPDVSPKLVELEVLENNALADLAHASRVIRACNALGVGFALDDFGTGYSSLTYLKQLPAGVLKIDQSFVGNMLHDPEDLAILEGVLGLANAFRRLPIAEGVETIAHGELLLRLGCELAQGFGIAHPMPADAMTDWISQWRPNEAWSSSKRLRHEELPVLYAGVEHRAWIQSIVDFLAEKRGVPPALSVHQCRFGRWLDDMTPQYAASAQEQFEQIRLQHEQVHTLASELIELHVSQQADAARAKLPQLFELRDQLLASLWGLNCKL